MRPLVRATWVFVTFNALVIGAAAMPWSRAPSAAAANIMPGHHVIHISVDGMGASYIASLIASGEAPNFKRLRDEGAWTINARTDYDYSITLPNHTGMLTGRPVLNQSVFAAQNAHGWTTNVTPPTNVTLHSNMGYYIASTFDVTHDEGLRTALFASKEKFVLYQQSYDAANGALDVTGADNGRAKLDVHAVRDLNTTQMMTELLAELGSASPASYSFVHFNDPDSAGHASNWGSAQHTAALKKVDGHLSELFAAIAANPVLTGNTTIILSADHGGTGSGHGDQANVLNYSIGFFLWGSNIPPNVDLYALNAGGAGAITTDPGSARPAFGLSQQPIRNGDGGNCAMLRLGLPPIPGSSMRSLQNACLPVPLPPLVLTPTPTPQPTVASELVARGSRWHYHDQGQDLGTAWRESAFVDGAWPQGRGPLGYDTGNLDPISTTIGYGGNATAKFITSYFRQAFTVTEPGAVQALLLHLRRDDGAVIFLNGIEVARSNMPVGAVVTSTLASVATTEELTYFTFAVPVTALVAGANVIAIEVHQAAPGSTDLVMDAQLVAQLVEATSTPTPTATATPTEGTATSTSTITSTATPEATATSTGTASATATFEATATPTQTATPTPTDTPTMVATATNTPTDTPILRPDLRVGTVRIGTQGSGCPDRTLFTIMTIENIGAGPSLTVTLRVNGNLQWLPVMQPGATLTLSMAGYVAGGPTVVEIDAEGVLVESDETNNVWSIMLPIPTPNPPCTATATATPTPTSTPEFLSKLRVFLPGVIR